MLYSQTVLTAKPLKVIPGLAACLLFEKPKGACCTSHHPFSNIMPLLHQCSINEAYDAASLHCLTVSADIPEEKKMLK